MSFAGYALGALLLLVVVLALCSTAVSLRRFLLPGWHGAEARLAELVLGSSAAVVLLQALGLVSLFRRPAIVIGAVAAALLAARLPRRIADDRPRARHDELVRGVPALMAAGAVILVLAQWLVSIHRNVRDGVQGYDALHYHLTFAGHFAQDHSILPTHRLDALGVSTWYPLNSELVLGAGMALLRTSALTLVIDLLALAAVVLAAWVLGAQRGVGPAAVVAACVPLSVLGPTYAGGSNNDWSAAWPLLAALALMLVARVGQQPLPLAIVGISGLAGGLALGTKLTVLVPAVVLFIVAVVLSPGRRRQAIGVSTGAHLLTGGYWFIRDLVIVGNPIPATKVGIGPLQLPKPATPLLDTQDFAVLHYLTDWSVIRRALVPGLDWFFGPAWPVVLLVIASGFVALLFRLRTERGLIGMALCGLGSIGAYLVTPTSAGGPEGEPFLFAVNIRYAMVGYTIGVLLLVLCTAKTSLEKPVLLLLGGLVIARLARPEAWITGWPIEPALLVLGLGAAAIAGWLLRHADRRAQLAVAVVVAIAGGFAGVTVEKRHDERSYQAGSPRDTLFAAARAETGQRIGIVGFPMQYPLMGPRLDNEVGYLGRTGKSYTYDDFDTCAGLLAEVRRQRVTRVVVQPYERRPTPSADAWLKADPHVRELKRTTAGVLFAVGPGVGPASCA